MTMESSRHGRIGSAVRALALVLAAVSAPATAQEAPTPEAALEELKALEGRWEGRVTSPDGPPGSVEYRVTAAGNTVMEVMFPGSEHEMISMYHLDHGKLVAKHFCSAGNQPEFVYEPGRSTKDRLVFAFAGGTNLDPERDVHMHGGTIARTADGELENVWHMYRGTEKIDENRFYLSRASR